MNRESFFEFYNSVIVKSANVIINIYSSEENDQFPKVSFINNFDGLYEEYLVQKNILKLAIKDAYFQRKGKPHVLDRHKVAACLVKAIISVRLLHYENINEDDNEVYLPTKASRVNEELAFVSGLQLLSMYIAADASDDKKEKILASLKKGFTFPPKITAENNYLDSTVRGLFYSNIMFGVNPILLANIFFLLESYFLVVNDIK